MFKNFKNCEAFLWFFRYILALYCGLSFIQQTFLSTYYLVGAMKSSYK